MFQEFFKPIVTPFEMELACLRCEKKLRICCKSLSAVYSTITRFFFASVFIALFFSRTREWTGDYITDFRELLPGSYMYILLFPYISPPYVVSNATSCPVSMNRSWAIHNSSIDLLIGYLLVSSTIDQSAYSVFYPFYN